MINENDLRVRKTLNNIRTAFTGLMEEKALTEFGVKDICDRAQCSRNTFYMYYPCKEAVLEEMTRECVEAILKGNEPIADSVRSIPEDMAERYTRGLMEAAYEEKERIRFLLRHDSGGFSALLADELYSRYIESAEQLVPGISRSAEAQLYCHYAAGGIVNYILHWMEHPEIRLEQAWKMLHNVHAGPYAASMEYLLRQSTEEGESS